MRHEHVVTRVFDDDVRGSRETPHGFQVRGEEDYGASGVYRRGERWPPELAAFEAHWRPFLELKSPTPDARLAAVRRVAAALPPGD